MSPSDPAHSRSRSTSASSLANRTGDWRTERPAYVRRLPPCNHGCPAGEDIQAWLYEAESGGEGYERAWRTLVAGQPVPRRDGTGSATTRARRPATAAQLDEAVGINSVERFLGDEAIRQGWDAPHPARAERDARARRRRRPLGPERAPTTSRCAATT